MEELDIKEIFKMFWEDKLIILIVTVAFMIVAATYSLLIQVPEYQSYTRLVLTKTENTGDTSSSVTQTDVTMNQKLVSTYSEIIKSDSILTQVIENLEIENLTVSKLREDVEVATVEDTEVIKITVSNENADDAAKIANEIGSVFAQKIREMYNLDNVYILDEAKADSSPYNIQPVKYIAIAMLAGIIISCIFVVTKNLLNTKIKSAEEIEKTLKLPVIAQLELIDELKAKKGGKI